MVDDMDENELKVLSVKGNRAMKRLNAMVTDRAFIGYLLIVFNLGLPIILSGGNARASLLMFSKAWAYSEIEPDDRQEQRS